MKRITGRRALCCLLALLMLLPALALPSRSANAETALATGYVSASKLNMRPDPSTRQAIVATLKRGDVVNVYEICGVWLRIDVPALGKSGYVSGKYITLNSNAGIYGLGITAGTVHVRSKNTAESESKSVLSGNTGLILQQMEANGWWKIKVPGDGLEGYIAKKFVTVICKAAKSSTSGSTETKATISGEGVNLRASASTASKSLGKLTKNTAVTVLGSSGSWYQVKVTSTGKTGYVYKTYVKLASAAATPTPNQTGTPGYINAAGVNLRTGPSTTTKSQGRLDKNTVVSVLNTSGSWCQVKVTSSGKTGYVSKTYVTLSATTPTPVPTATPTNKPTAAPTATPTNQPTATPTATPTPVPTATPTPVPTATPTPSASPGN